MIMMWNEQTQQESRRLVESVTQKQWNAIMYAFEKLAYPTKEEENAKKLEQEKRGKTYAAMLAEYEQIKAAFYEMDKKINKNLSIPERYEWSYDELYPLFRYAIHPRSGNEGIYNLANVMFNLGFKRGMSYQQSKTAKRDNRIMKTLRHPSQIKALKQTLDNI